LERTREIGTLRAIGFKEKQITRLFTFEGVFLATLCLPIGYLTAMTISWLINSIEFMFEVPGISTKIKVILEFVPLTSIVLGAALVAVTGLAGWMTSRRTSKKTITGLLQTHVS
jgi:putative ABC transport system permease protein